MTQLHDLMELLDRERAALIAGDLSKLKSVSEGKAGLIDSLDATNVQSVQMLKALAKRARRNEKLIEASLKGLRDVSARLHGGSVAEPLRTYGQNGKTQSLQPCATMVRRSL